MEKWSKIIKIMFIFACVAGTDALLSEQLSLKQVKNHKQSPQQWHAKMIQKYPKAGLEKITLVDGRGWAMGHFRDGSVFVTCPYDTYDGIKAFTPDDELALLHEAGHARNHRWTKLFYKKNYQKTLAAALFVASFLGTGGVQKSINLKTDLLKNREGLVLNSFVSDCKYPLLYSGLYLVLSKIIPPLANRCDEILADDFARQYGDAEALKGGYEHFMNHAKRQKSAYKNFIDHWRKDFAHPASFNRAQAIAKTLWSKYGQVAPLIY